MSQTLEQADDVLSFEDLVLHLVAGGGDLSLDGEHRADERDHGGPHSQIESPACEERVWF